ncbi:unnamed protein product [Symbiodinium sp. CCMP2592]|nr:unnamed protein product [Symbiodinium sp. CCMP2592]
MGTVVCSRCSDTGDSVPKPWTTWTWGANESVMFSEEDLVVARAATATGTLLDQLQGKWVRQDGFFMGVLTNGRLRWGEAFRGDSQSLLEEAGPNKVHLRLAGEVHEGSVYVGRRMSIHWADGAPKQLLHAVAVYTAMSVLSVDVSAVQVLCQRQEV